MGTYQKERPETIQQMFDAIADQYDRGNAILSFQLHRWWNRQLIEQVVLPYTPEILLDLCAGTGEIAFSYLKRFSEPKKAILLDFSREMLSVAERKSDQLDLSKHQINFLQADAQQIPLDDESVDCVTVAYGIRNVKSPSKCFEEVFRVLKPGGTFGILELTRPTNPVLRSFHALYLKLFIPMIGKMVLSNQNAYSYLQSSIKNFSSPSDLSQQLQRCGFNQCQSTPLSGGIATIIRGSKPRRDE